MYKVVAELVNNKENTYCVSALPDLHPAFSEDLQLDFSCMPGEVIAEEVTRQLTDSRAKLMKVINKWERSGNSFGQRSKEDNEYGHFKEEQLEDGDN